MEKIKRLEVKTTESPFTALHRRDPEKEQPARRALGVEVKEMAGPKNAPGAGRELREWVQDALSDRHNSAATMLAGLKAVGPPEVVRFRSDCEGT
jgi:hypothetical protein